MYKVFFNNRLIILKQIENEEDEEAFLHKCNARLGNILEIFFNKKGPDEIIFEHQSLDILFDDFKSNFKFIEAAGGLVFNEKNEFLYIERLGFTDLPKGKVEKGENIKDAAIREVTEECGISGLEITKELPSTYHIYELKNKKILKRTYWFEMKYTGNEKLIPQTEEDITKVAFVNKKEAEKLREKSYQSLKELFEYVTTKIIIH